MKIRSKLILLFIVASFFCLSGFQKSFGQNLSVGFQVFYDELSPHGSWIESPDYGYVWLPNVAYGFTPYSTNGYWVYTNEGWTWVSNYSWGWAPFHYGRWFNDDTYGYMWVPDYEWGPGWVTWRRSEGYYGWAPIRPGISINIAYSNNYSVPNNQWVFVRGKNFGRTDINKYYINAKDNVTIIKNSTVINNEKVDKSKNVTFNQGPDRIEVEKKSGRKIEPFLIKENSKPGENLSESELSIYRPTLQKNSDADKKPLPSKVQNIKDMKTLEQKNTKNSQRKEAFKEDTQKPLEVEKQPQGEKSKKKVKNQSKGPK